MDGWAEPVSPFTYLPSIELTSTGYPLVSAFTFTDMLGYPMGTYTLVYSSTGTATVTPASMGSIVANTTSTVSVNGVTTTTVQVLVQSDPTDPRLVLNANNVDANDQLSNLHFYMPGYVPGQTPPELNPNVASRLAPFGTLRLMGELNTNSTDIANWTDRDMPADFSDVDNLGIPYEDAVAIANELQVNLWWNIPVAATPNSTTDGTVPTSAFYMTDLADLIKYGSDGINPYTGPIGSAVSSTNTNPIPATGPVYPGVDSNLRVYVEFGNELWHTGYPDDTYNIAAGEADPDIPGSSLPNANPAWFDAANNNGEFAYSAEQDVYQLRQAYNAFSSVYGAGLSSEISFVLAGDVSTSVFTQAAFTYLTDMTAQWGAPSSWITAFAVPTYVSLSAFDDPGLTLNQIFSNLDGQLTTGFASTISADVQFASSYNLPLFSYEGGQYLIPDNENAAVKHEAEIDPRMGQFYTELLNEWYSLGGSLILPFDFAGPESTGGDWGLLQSASDAGSPRWDAVIQRLVPAGDANLDGVVDWNDFLILKANYGMPGASWQQGNFDGDSAVDAADYEILAQNINTAGWTAAQLSEFNNFLATAATAVQLPDGPNNIIGTSGSYLGDGNTIANVFDGNVNTFLDGQSANGNTVGLNFGSQDTIEAIRFAPRPGFEQRMLGGYFEASNDPTFETGDVILIPPITTAPSDGLTTEEINVPGTYQYFQYVSPAGSWGNIGEIQVYGEPPATAGTPTISPTTTIQGQQSATGLVITAADPTTVSYQISNITNGTLYQADGVTPISNGEFIALTQATAGLKFTPAAQEYTSANTTFSFSAQASSTDDSGGLGGGIATAGITVTQLGVLLTPTITVSDPTRNYTGGPFIATGSITSANGTSIATPTLNYYLAGDTAFANPLNTAPTAVGSYVAVASFAGNGSYAAGSQQVSFSITPATPIVSVADAGGTYTGAAFTATATVTGVSGGAVASLEGVVATPIYNAGSTASGNGTSTAPNAPGNYTVVAEFPGSPDYAPANSPPVNFTIAAVTTPVKLTPASTTASTPLVWPGTPVEPYSSVFDGNTNTYWDSLNPSGNWVQEGFSVPANITSIAFAPRAGFDSRMAGGVFEASNDPSFGSFATLYTVNSTPTDGLTTVNVSGTYQYVRYVAPNGSYGNIAEMQVFGIPTTGPVPVVSSGPTATVSASGTSATLAIAASETGNPALTYTWSAATLPSGVTAAPTFSATNGTLTGNAVTVSFPAGDTSGTYVFDVKITDPSNVSTLVPLSVTVGQVLTSITLTPSGTTVSVPASTTQSFMASGNDQFGNAMATQPTFTWSSTGAGTINAGSGVYTASASVGSTAIVTATAIGSNGSVLANQAVQTTAAPATPVLLTPTTTSASTTSTWANSTTTTYSSVFDGNTSTFWDSAVANGNWVQEVFSAPVTITSIAYAPRAGFESRMAGGIFEASNDPTFATGVVTLCTLTSTPGDGFTTQTVSATGTFQYVRYVAPAGSYGNIADMRIYGIASTGPTPVVSSGPTATVSATGTTAALAVAASETGNPTLTYTWSTATLPNGVSTAPTFSSSNGTSGGNAVTVSFFVAGAYTLDVTITDPSNDKIVVPLSVTVGQVLTSIALTPSGATVSVPASTTQSFIASGNDQFGKVMATQPTFAWSSTGAGSINASSGVYTASASVGATAAITATAAGSNGAVTTSQAVQTTAAPTAPVLLTSAITSASTTATWANSTTSTYSAVFDNNTNTFWDSAVANGNWVQEGFSAPATITSIAYAPRAGFEYRMVGGIFEASNDPTFSTGVVTLYTITSTPSDGFTTQAISVTGTYQYIRYVAPSGSYGNIADMRIYGLST
jgi:hypothetical protein